MLNAITPAQVEEVIRPRSELPAKTRRYGLGFWLDGAGERVLLEGCDAGVSFWSAHDPRDGTTCTVISNTTDGLWFGSFKWFRRCHATSIFCCTCRKYHAYGKSEASSDRAPTPAGDPVGRQRGAGGGAA